MKRWISAIVVAWLLCVLVLSTATAYDVPASIEREYNIKYQTQILGFQSKKLKIAEYKTHLKRLKDLGFYSSTDYSINRRTMDSDIGGSDDKIAISLFCQHVGLPEETSLTPLLRALLSDESLSVHPYFRVLDTKEYYMYSGPERENDKHKRIPYSDDKLNLLNPGQRCVVHGEIVKIDPAFPVGEMVSLVVRSNEGGEYSTEYRYPPRSSRFMKGDRVVVFGTVKDPKGIPYVISADVIGLQ